MKKLVFGLIATVVFGSLSYGQDNGIAESLSKDNDFIALVNESIDFYDFLYKNIDEQSFSKEDLLNNLSKLNSSKSSFDEQQNEINEIFKFNVSEKLNEHNDSFYNGVKKINEKFKNVDEETFKLAYQNVIDSKLNNTTSYSLKKCGWRFNLCLAASFAATAVCDGGCNTTALATTGGLGIPACVWACGTMEVYLGVQCYDNYCK